MLIRQLNINFLYKSYVTCLPIPEVKIYNFFLFENKSSVLFENP